ncbi:ATP-binding cassette, subfamily C [Enhydrobacter aerosaccus]|uniref:ATP-binding cassette, subfamily C n=1 Tax=Enhydrobacter aerosaccus TaxID=225324 RepID=A0A1T4K8X5_9HYPH|nr:type I secretion system permease/ATPase [Enhydrobacter aerosaccus]SJZ38773.1 ATP-binding cassette, subfamily C [Enhydrobacter aerosaccus]
MTEAALRPASSELAKALASCRGAFVGIGVFSGVLNILYLTGSFFMLEVYDRVLPSRSVPTLVGLAALALLLYAFQGLLDIIRGRTLQRVARFVDDTVSLRIYRIVVRLPLLAPAARGVQPLQELDNIRSFMATVGPAALFDLPWIPLYLAICFLFHPLIGAAATVGGLLLVGITLLTEFMTRAPAREAGALASRRSGLADSSRRNAEAVQAMGMAGRLGTRWNEINQRYLDTQQRAADIAIGLGSISKVLRMVLQSAVLGIGAYLVINQQATAGIIIASSILTARALAPVELAISQWRGFVAARQSWHRLADLLNKIPADREPLPLPKPSHSVVLEAVTVVPPGSGRVAAHEVTFQLTAGHGLGIVGPSASGKSSLARAIVGVWVPAAGKIRLDGAALDQWAPEALGQHIGYLPQDMELFAGSVAQNIARFDPRPDAESVIAAAKAAGVHELILGLPDGYETQIGDGGTNLSTGQRQRIGLARALYGDPFLVVLDEPNSNLDKEGDEALTQAILGVRKRGGIVIVIAHRPSALAGVDTVLVMRVGRQQAFGPLEVAQGHTTAPTPLRTSGAIA